MKVNPHSTSGYCISSTVNVNAFSVNVIMFRIAVSNGSNGLWNHCATFTLILINRQGEFTNSRIITRAKCNRFIRLILTCRHNNYIT